MIRSTFNFLFGADGNPEPELAQGDNGVHSARYPPSPKPLLRRSKSFSTAPILKRPSPEPVTQETMGMYAQEIRKMGTSNCEPKYGRSREAAEREREKRLIDNVTGKTAKKVSFGSETSNGEGRSQIPTKVWGSAGLFGTTPAKVEEAEFDKLTNRVAVQELRHFLFFELRGRNPEAMSLNEAIKIIGSQYPKLYDIIQKAPLPLEAKLSQRRQLHSANVTDSLEQSLVVFIVEKCSDVFVIVEGKHHAKHFAFNPAITKFLNKLVDRFEDVLKEAVALAIQQHLENGPVALGLLRRAMLKDHPYLTGRFLNSNDLIIKVIKKNPDALKLNDDEDTAMLAKDYKPSKSPFKRSKSASDVGSMRFPAKPVFVGVQSYEELKSRIVKKPITPPRYSPDVSPVKKARPSSLSSHSSSPQQTIRPSINKKLTNLSKPNDLNKRRESASEVTDDTPRSTSYQPGRPFVATDHGRNCLCNKDLQLILKECDNALFDDFAARHIKCLIAFVKKEVRGRNESTPIPAVKKSGWTFSVKASTQTDIDSLAFEKLNISDASDNDISR